MSARHTASTLLAVLGLTTALSSTAAFAGAFGLGEQSTYGTGMAYAGVAAGGSLSTQFWNPATLGEVDGFVYETDLSAILPVVNVRTNALGPLPAQSQGNIGIGAVLPATYLGYRVNQNVVLGLGINSPFGLATRYEPGSSYLALKGVASGSRLFTINVNPNIAYQITSQFTVAAGVQGQYMDLRETGFGAATGDFHGTTKSIGFGFTLGAEFKPMKGTSIGIGYRSGITNKVEGTLSGSPVPAASFAGTLSVKTPSQLSLGVSQDVGELWTVKAGVTYTNWSVLGSVPVTGPAAVVIKGGFGSPNIPFNYRDGWLYSAGAEYTYSPEVTLRGGLGYEISPIDTEARNFRLPDSDRIWLSAGLSYAFAKNMTLDAGYSFLHALSTNINSAATGGPATNSLFSGSVNGNTHILSLANKAKLGG